MNEWDSAVAGENRMGVIAHPNIFFAKVFRVYWSKWWRLKYKVNEYVKYGKIARKASETPLRSFLLEEMMNK